MKYFVDFEANARTQEIISIGVIDEEGRTFKTLVRPTTKVDRKITELTGITEDAAQAAPTINAAAFALAQWLQEHLQGPCIFYNWGSTDKDFLKASMDSTDYIFTKQILGYIQNHLHNLCPVVSKRFNSGLLALRSVYLTMRMESAESLPATHDALSDAEMLKYVYENYESYQLPEGAKFVKVPRPNLGYGKLAVLDEKYRVPIHVTYDDKKHGHREWDFPTVKAAMSVIPRLAKNTNKIKVMDRILAAAESGQKYAGRTFSLGTSD